MSQLVQRIYVNDLVFFDQYVTFVEGLHVESLPAIHFVPLFHGFSNSNVSSAVPYSCLLFSMCNAYAGNLRERSHWEDLDVDGRIILRWILGKWEGVETGWSWLRIGTDGGYL